MTYIKGLLVYLSVTLYVTLGYAIAQDTGVVSRQSFLYDVWTIVQPVVTMVVTVAAPVVVAWITLQVSRLLNVTDENAKKELEKKIRDALHQAAENALKFALSKKTGAIPDLLTGKIPQDVIDDAIGYVRGFNPDTAAEAGLDNKGLEDIILSKVPDVLATIAQSRTPEVVEVKPVRAPATKKK